ncbi:hypothetical protein NKH84_29080 [Mesorhizobium sp. M0902]|uniref:hypothetical protein n=1 Tax=Mesorhizobium sp. M0902 TaxID=2957021 RepID=UPI00333C7CED
MRFVRQGRVKLLALFGRQKRADLGNRCTRHDGQLWTGLDAVADGGGASGISR